MIKIIELVGAEYDAWHNSDASKSSNESVSGPHTASLPGMVTHPERKVDFLQCHK